MTTLPYSLKVTLNILVACSLVSCNQDKRLSEKHEKNSALCRLNLKGRTIIFSKSTISNEIVMNIKTKRNQLKIHLPDKDAVVINAVCTEWLSGMPEKGIALSIKAYIPKTNRQDRMTIYYWATLFPGKDATKLYTVKAVEKIMSSKSDYELAGISNPRTQGDLIVITMLNKYRYLKKNEPIGYMYINPCPLFNLGIGTLYKIGVIGTEIK